MAVCMQIAMCLELRIYTAGTNCPTFSSTLIDIEAHLHMHMHVHPRPPPRPELSGNIYRCLFIYLYIQMHVFIAIKTCVVFRQQDTHAPSQLPSTQTYMRAHGCACAYIYTHTHSLSLSIATSTAKSVVYITIDISACVHLCVQRDRECASTHQDEHTSIHTYVQLCIYIFISIYGFLGGGGTQHVCTQP